MIKRFLDSVTLSRGDTALRIVVNATVRDDTEGTDALATKLLQRTPQLGTEYDNIVSAALTLRDAVLAYALAAGKPLTTEQP